jgi:hypothetical protein
VSGELVNLSSRRPEPPRKSARFEATLEGDVALTIVLESGELVDVTMDPAQARRLLEQGEAAAAVAEGLAR